MNQLEDLLLEEDLLILKKSVQQLVKEYPDDLDPMNGTYRSNLPEETKTYLHKKAKSSGLWAFGAKEEWGGAGLSLYARTVLYEEAAKHRLGLYKLPSEAFGYEMPSFLENCTQEQVEAYVKPAIRDGKSCFLALWEEHEDNHMENLSCTAVKEGDEWVINGHKSYIQDFNQAHFGVILVNCVTGNGKKQPTLFILEPNEAFEIRETVLMDIQTSHHLSFHNFRLSDNKRIGQVGNGEKWMKKSLLKYQILLAARCVGVSAKALQYAKEYAEIRITRGKPLAEFPTIRNMIANGTINLQAARLMVQDAANKTDSLEKGWEIAAQMAKHFATEMASKIINDALQIHGGAGFAGDLPFERWYKEIRIARVNLQKSETIIENVATFTL